MMTGFRIALGVSWVLLLAWGAEGLRAQSLTLVPNFVDATPTFSGFPIPAGDVDGDGANDYVVRQRNVYGPNGVATINNISMCACLPTFPSEDVIVSGMTGAVLADYRVAAGAPLANALVYPVGRVNSDPNADYILVHPISFPLVAPMTLELMDGATHQSLATTTQTVFVGGTDLTDVKLLGDLNGDGHREIATLVRNFVFPGPSVDPYIIRSGLDLSILASVSAPGRITETFGDLGDVDQDGVPDYFLASSFRPPQGIALPGQIEIFSGATHALIRTLVDAPFSSDFGVEALVVSDLDGDGDRDFIVSRGGQNAAGVTVPRVYSAISSVTAAPIWTITAAAGETLLSIQEAGDPNGDGVLDVAVGIVSSNSSRLDLFSKMSGALVRSALGPLNPLPGAPVADYLAGDLNGDGISDQLRTVADPSGNYIFACGPKIEMGTQAYGAGTGSASLRYAPYPWEPREGVLELAGISPNASALIAVSLAPAAATIIGTALPLHVSLAPADLLILAPLVANGAGVVQLGATLNQPQIAGTIIYLQMAETAPTPTVSNGLELIFGT